jgi:hypothetical protein
LGLLFPAFSTDIASFSTGLWVHDPGSLLRGCGFSNFASIELDSALQGSTRFKKMLADRRKPLALE